jgi:hypothetical protein
MKKGICESFPISNEEYRALEKDFGQLTKYESWQLLRKNAKNNHTDDFEDINQELLMALMRAGSYYKRQVYIERCFEVSRKYVKDEFIIKILDELQNLWDNKTRHGANRQKFGPNQEHILNKIVLRYVPFSVRPKKNCLLEIDAKFATYAKAITWNEMKRLGRKITKEKSIRTGVVSLSDFDYLGCNE